MPLILLVLLAIFLPPVAVFLKVGLGAHFWVNLLLVILVVSFPAAMIHALFVVLKDT